MTTTKMKFRWLHKRKHKYINTVTNAFHIVKRELIQFLNDYKGPVDILIKYLANCTTTEDPMTFIKLMEGVITDAKQYSDASSRKAFLLCSYIVWRFAFLSKFTINWTNVKIKCNKCQQVVTTNYLYSDKICPHCGNIIL